MSYYWRKDPLFTRFPVSVLDIWRKTGSDFSVYRSDDGVRQPMFVQWFWPGLSSFLSTVRCRTSPSPFQCNFFVHLTLYDTTVVNLLFQPIYFTMLKLKMVFSMTRLSNLGSGLTKVRFRGTRKWQHIWRLVRGIFYGTILKNSEKKPIHL